jgi:hypothetical protein
MSHPLFLLLAQLEAAHIHFTLSRHRADTVLVTLTVVGERIEIDAFEDGQMEVSRFKGNEDVLDGSELIAAILRENAQ